MSRQPSKCNRCRVSSARQSEGPSRNKRRSDLNDFLIRTTPQSAGYATDQYADNDGVSLHKKDVRNEGNAKVGGPEADFRKVRVEGVVMRPPSSPHGQELDDSHRDSRQVAIGKQDL